MSARVVMTGFDRASVRLSGVGILRVCVSVRVGDGHVGRGVGPGLSRRRRAAARRGDHGDDDGDRARSRRREAVET